MVFDDKSLIPGTFPDGRREWEPADVLAFAESDPLNPNNQEWGERLRSQYDAEIEFFAWSRMQAQLRGQAWREREISAFLRGESFRLRWDEAEGLEGLESMGVGRRPWNAVGPPGIGVSIIGSGELKYYRNSLGSGDFKGALIEYENLSSSSRQSLRWDPLSIVLSFREPLRLVSDLYSILQIGPFQALGSRVEPLAIYGLHEIVPVVLQESREYSFRSTPQAGSVFQAGQRIYTKPGPGVILPGTLTALVKYKCDKGECLGLLGAQHVLGDKNEPVYQNGMKIGQVICSDAAVDVSLVELSGSPQWKQEILSHNLDPAQPIDPVSGMPGEYYGSETQTTEESYIGLVFIEPPSFYKVGKAPRFEMEGDSKSGDSGALVLSGHNQQDAVSPNLARYIPSLGPDQLAAILGMMIAGDTSRRNCSLPATILATPAKDIQATLKNKNYDIQWLTR